MRMHQPGLLWPTFGVALALLASNAASAQGGTCTVPGTHPTIQEAIDNDTCTTISLPQSYYAESIEIDRDLNIEGNPSGVSLLGGRMSIVGDASVDTENFEILSSCTGALVTIEGTASFQSEDFAAAQGGVHGCPELGLLFADGFESGNTSAWSSTTP